AAKKKSSKEFHPGLRGRETSREAALIDRSIIHVSLYLIRGVKKEEKLKKVGPNIEDFLQTTSEDEPDIKDDTSPKEDVGNVYCCDDNGDVPLFFMPGKPISQPTNQDFSSNLSMLNGFCSLSQTREEKGDCEHYKYTYSSKQEDQIIRLADQRQQDDISNMAEVAEQKIQSEIPRLYNHRETMLNKIAEEDKQRKCIRHMNSYAHMKLAIEMCMPKKRKYVNVMRSLYSGLSTTLNVPSIEQLANQKNVLNPFMIEKCKSVKPWIEDLSLPFKRIDKIFLSHDLEEFLSRSVVGHCKFPWCNDITVDRSFWNGLCGLDDNRKGWLFDEKVLHDWGDEECIEILRKCKEAIPQDKGKVIIVDAIVGQEDHEFKDVVLMLDMVMMAHTSKGKERTLKEWSYVFTQAGFTRYTVKHIRTYQSVIEVYP
ncbi:phospholipase-like protein, partial [Tanacetum coccineum]